MKKKILILTEVEVDEHDNWSVEIPNQLNSGDYSSFKNKKSQCYQVHDDYTFEEAESYLNNAPILEHFLTYWGDEEN